MSPAENVYEQACLHECFHLKFLILCCLRKLHYFKIVPWQEAQVYICQVENGQFIHNSYSFKRPVMKLLSVCLSCWIYQLIQHLALDEWPYGKSWLIWSRLYLTGADWSHFSSRKLESKYKCPSWFLGTQLSRQIFGLEDSSVGFHMHVQVYIYIRIAWRVHEN